MKRITAVFCIIIVMSCSNNEVTENDIELYPDNNVKLIRSWLRDSSKGNLVCSFTELGYLKQITRHDSLDKLSGKNVKYFSNGLPQEVFSYDDGEAEGVYIQYYESGILKAYGSIDKTGKKQGSWILYHENGLVKEVGNYVNNSLDGEFKTYHNNGVISLVGNYENSTENDEWEFYDLDGTHLETIEYLKGDVIKREKHNDSSYGIEITL